jgi:hypothetical protein
MDSKSNRVVLLLLLSFALVVVTAPAIASSPAFDGTWSQLMPVGGPPSPRDQHTAIYDPVRDRMVVYGGGAGAGEVWALTLTGTPQWTQLMPSGPSPAPRWAHTAIYDPVRDRVVVFGGMGPGPMNDVWALSLGAPPQWTQILPTGAPPTPRYEHSAIYDPVRDRMIVFGGSSGGNDVWTLSLGGSPQWTQLFPAGGTPSPRMSHTAIYDPVRDRMLIFAGISFVNDVWSLSLGGAPQWLQLTPSGTPPNAREDHTAIYDPVRDRMVVFGGKDYLSVQQNDVWDLSLAASPQWTQLAPSGPLPATRRGQTAIYDPVRDWMIAFAGSGVGPVYNDTWALTWGTPTGVARVSVVPTYGATNCANPITYTFAIDQFTGPIGIRGYDVTFQITTSVVRINGVGADITEGSYLKSVAGPAGTVFYPLDKGGGVYTVSGAILSTTSGATGTGNLFTVRLWPVAQGTSPIDITTLKIRDVNNQPIISTAVDGTVQVDCNPPTMEPISEAQGQCYKTAPVFSNFGFDDDVNLDLAEYRIDGAPWTTIFSGINAASWDSDGWVLPGFSGLSEGPHTVFFHVKDDAGNWNGDGSPNMYSWAFTKDTMSPSPPTGFMALPGNHKVHLTWTNPTGDPSFMGVEIRRVRWGDYPQYGTPGPSAPSYPSDPTQGTLVTRTPAQNYDDNPLTPRDIYYYAAFSYDCAGNYSSASSGARDRSTNYWLADISPSSSGDGLVDITDLSKFAMAFGSTQSGGGGWNSEADFGPTDDWCRLGIPLPDDAVNFEDLMILAMNYWVVTPAGTSGGLIALAGTAPLGEQVSFRLVPVSREDGKTTYAVVMENASEILKGFSLKVAYGVGNALEGVTASRELSGKAAAHFFGVIEPESGVVEICVAALGVNSPFEFTGEVARVVVRETTEGSVGLKTADLRDVNNGRDEVTLPGGGGETPYIPVTTALLQNHPNPFNPTTAIPYEVATAGRVEIAIYDVSGSLVRTLVSGEKPIGRHVATWDGRDGSGSQVHTGVYFYRMTAPGYTSQAKKMLLLK